MAQTIGGRIFEQLIYKLLTFENSISILSCLLLFHLKSKMTQKKGGEIRELQDKLNSNQLTEKLQAIRRIIDAMTRGKDVSVLFMDVIKNIVTPSLQLKKLIYLYIMNYAKHHPDLAILGINSFRKDSIDKSNPFLRALAVRTMGCIRIKQVAEYLCDPLKMALKDEDSYVRKTAVLCVPKLYEISPDLIEQQGFLKILQTLLNDGNAMVVSNTVAALMICGENKGQTILKLTAYIVQKLLIALDDCNQWGTIYILDALSTYIPVDSNEAEGIMQRISSRLAHTNSAVSLSAIRLVMKYMDYLNHPQSIRNYSLKISAPLITLLSREPEIAYITLKTINLILQKRPLIIPKEIKIFFIKYHDPSYIKLEKLEILAKVANNDNINLILHELKEYSQEVDVEIVRRSIRVIGRCAIKLEKMADKCVQALWQALKTKVNYVVQQSIIVIRDIFRKYPNKYEALLKDICQNLKSLDDAEAKSSIIWIIGEYVQMIENADELLQNFCENFKDEPDIVQQQILISCVKLFLLKPEDGQEIVKDLLKVITTQCQNPDLRDRGFIYWRLIATNPALAKKVVFSQRPLISDQSYTIETQLLDRLIENIGTLSAIYYKEPEAFVKKLKDNANARQVIQEYGEQLLPQQPEKVQFFAETPKVVTFSQNNTTNNSNIQNTNIVKQPSNVTVQNSSNLLDTTTETVYQPPQPVLNTQPVISQIQQPKPVVNLMDDDILGMNTPSVVKVEPQITNSQIYSTGIQQPYGSTIQPSVYNTQSYVQQPTYSTISQPQQPSIITQQQAPNIFLQQQSNKNIVIPLVPVVAEADFSLNNKIQGLCVKAGFQKQKDRMYLDLLLQNNSNLSLSEFAIKFNVNSFGLSPQNLLLNLPQIQIKQSKKVRVPIITNQQYSEITSFPFKVEVALKTNVDMYIFSIPCSMTVFMVPNSSITIQKYKQIASNPSNFKKQEALNNSLQLDQFITKLTDNNVSMVFRKQSNNNELMSYSCLLLNGMYTLIDCIFEKTTKAVNIQITSPTEKVAVSINHAINMIINL